MGHGGNTEFVDLHFETQLKKLNLGLEIFKKQNLDVKVFFDVVISLLFDKVRASFIKNFCSLIWRRNEPLAGEAASFIDRLDEALKDDPSIQEYVERLEKYFDDIVREEDLEIFSQQELSTQQNAYNSSDFPNTEDLVEDLEDFLRKRRNAD